MVYSTSDDWPDVIDERDARSCFPFLMLPFEIRRDILYYICINLRVRYRRRFDDMSSSSRTRAYDPPAILIPCKQIREEAMKFFWQEATFVINLLDVPVSLGAVRRLAIDSGWCEFQHFEHWPWFCRVRESSQALNELTFEVSASHKVSNNLVRKSSIRSIESTSVIHFIRRVFRTDLPFTTRCMLSIYVPEEEEEEGEEGDLLHVMVSSDRRIEILDVGYPHDIFCEYSDLKQSWEDKLPAVMAVFWVQRNHRT